MHAARKGHAQHEPLTRGARLRRGLVKGRNAEIVFFRASTLAGGALILAGTVLVTIVAGPLNYLGVNPKIKCDIPQPSK